MKHLIILNLLFICSFSQAQQLNVKWTEKQLFDNKADGFFNYFMGGNSKYIYANYSNIGRGFNMKKGTMRIVAFDKNTLKRIKAVMVTDYKNNPKLKETYKDMDYYKTVIFEEVIFIFWTKYDKGKQELFVQTYDAALKPLNKLKKIYQVTSDKKDAKMASLFVMANKKSNEQILIGAELSTGKSESVKMEYKLLNKDFTFASSNQITLPIKVASRSAGLTSSYHFGDDGNLYVKSYVAMSKEEWKKAKKGESRRYAILTLINLKTAAIKSYPIKFENKDISNFDFLVDANSVKLFGFFTDLIKDPKGNDTHGIFYALLDNKTFEMSNANFAMFTKDQLNTLFAKDKEDQKRGRAMQSKKKKKSDDESITSDYVIENVQSIDKDNIVLFCSRMRNYTVTTCDGKGNCTTNYYCEKRNVTGFRLSKDGKITWASNVDRSRTYSGWNVYDVSVVNNNNKFYVTYGSSFDTDAKKKNFFSRKSRKEMRDKFEYSVFDYGNGKFVKKEHEVNTANTPKKERKLVSPTGIEVIENQFYVASTKTTYKTLPMVLGCLGAIVCPPVIFIPAMLGSTKKGSGYLGTITPVK